MAIATATPAPNMVTSDIITQLGSAGVQSRFVEVAGLRTHYLVAGEQQRSTPLLLLHGMAMGSEYWVNNLAELGEQHPVYAPTFWGHGWSASQLRLRHTLANFVAFVRRFMQELGLEKVNLVGHSMGGHIAARFALDNPALVERLILVDPAGLKRTEPLPLAFLNTFRDADMQNPKYRKLVMRLTRQSWNAQRQGETVRMVVRSTLDADLLRLQAPTLLIWGRHDQLVPLRYAEEWQRLIPHARLEVLDTSHTVMYHLPDEFNRIVLNFCNQSPLPNGAY